MNNSRNIHFCDGKCMVDPPISPLNGPYICHLEVDGSLFKRMIDAGRVNIGWDTCFVYEALDVMRCFKCCGYHHLAKSCKNSKLCAKCGQAHEDECKSSTERCVNCCDAVKRLKINIDVAHSAFSKDCTVYQRKLDSERKKINYKFQHAE